MASAAGGVAVTREDRLRAALIERFDLSQRVYQKDPWAERAQPREARRFRPVADLSLEAAE